LTRETRQIPPWAFGDQDGACAGQGRTHRAELEGSRNDYAGFAQWQSGALECACL
jgi:hypothetical protein